MDNSNLFEKMSKSFRDGLAQFLRAASGRVNRTRWCRGYMSRRKRVEKFLREIGVELAESTSHNPLEQVWSLGEGEFIRRVGRDELKVYKSAREETMSATEEIVKVEFEVDERVRVLYGL